MTDNELDLAKCTPEDYNTYDDTEDMDLDDRMIAFVKSPSAKALKEAYKVYVNTAAQLCLRIEAFKRVKVEESSKAEYDRLLWSYEWFNSDAFKVLNKMLLYSMLTLSDELKKSKNRTNEGARFVEIIEDYCKHPEQHRKDVMGCMYKLLATLETECPSIHITLRKNKNARKDLAYRNIVV